MNDSENLTIPFNLFIYFKDGENKYISNYWQPPNIYIYISFFFSDFLNRVGQLVAVSEDHILIQAND